MSFSHMLRIMFFSLLVIISTSLQAQLQTPLIFSNGMVLQRHHEIPFYGTATAGAEVKLEFLTHKDTVLADASGNWEFTIPPQDAGGPYQVKLTSGTDAITLEDVYIGEVWLASGQSNMAWVLRDAEKPVGDLDYGEYPAIRQFYVRPSLKAEPQKDVSDGSTWYPADIENRESFSAVAYYFARYLYDYLNVPIGIVNASYGGTRIETWMSEEELGYDEKDIVFDASTNRLQPTMTYNGMIHPLPRFPVKGVIWYQGESNAGSNFFAVHYRYLFKKLIRFWRELWNEPDLPFLWVQLANFNNPASEDNPGSWSSWPLLRESQTAALDLSMTGEALAIDVGAQDIHPTNKQPVGKRLSLLARKQVYGDTVIHHGPLYKDHVLLDNGAVEISFTNPGDSLVTIDGQDRVKWFSVVRQNGSVLKANAMIENGKVHVWNDQVNNPYAIRYAWETNPVDVNFYNEAGLPATPFYIYVNDSEARLHVFEKQHSFIDRGNSTIVRWTVSGPVEVFFNQQPVDLKDARRVWATRDTTMYLDIRDSVSHELLIHDSLVINVRQPEPVINITDPNIGFMPLDSTLTITTAVSPEGGGAITKVTFMVNGTEVATDDSEPFTFSYLADSTGTFIITAIATNAEGLVSLPDTLEVHVRELTFSKYEAEDAHYAIQAVLRTDKNASEGEYLELLKEWSVRFDSIIVPYTGTHMAYFRQKLNYGSPRLQTLRVNDSIELEIVFEADDIYTWTYQPVPIQLDSGINTLELESKWGYMSLDLLKLGSDVMETVPADTTVSHIALPGYFPETGMNLFPNPAGYSTNLQYHADPGKVILRVYDQSGRVVLLAREFISSEGIYEKSLDLSGLPPAIYFLRISDENGTATGKLIVTPSLR